MYETDNSKKVIKFILTGVVGLVVLVLLLTSWTIVGSGERGVVLRFGEVQRVLDPGFHWKMPLVESVKDMEVRTQKIETGASAGSQDLQIVTTQLALQFNLVPGEVGDIYEELRDQYRDRVVDPAIQDAIKAATAQFNAEELITKRSEVKRVTEKILTERLREAHIRVTNVDIIDFDFSEEFNLAIEAKVKAEQQALEQANITRQEEEKKKQQILKAQAVAEKTRLEAEALRLNAKLIDKIRAEAALKAAEKWDGSVPDTVIIGGSGGSEVPIFPFLNVEK